MITITIATTMCTMTMIGWMLLIMLIITITSHDDDGLLMSLTMFIVSSTNIVRLRKLILTICIRMLLIVVCHSLFYRSRTCQTSHICVSNFACFRLRSSLKHILFRLVILVMTDDDGW